MRRYLSAGVLVRVSRRRQAREDGQVTLRKEPGRGEPGIVFPMTERLQVVVVAIHVGAAVIFDRTVPQGGGSANSPPRARGGVDPERWSLDVREDLVPSHIVLERAQVPDDGFSLLDFGLALRVPGLILGRECENV